MKKTIALALVLISLLALCSCGGGTKLTKNNFKTYFKLEPYPDLSDCTTISGYAGFSKMRIACKCSAISNNYNYSNVTVKIKVKGHYDYFDQEASYLAGRRVYIDPSVNFESTVKIDIDISGNGEGFSTNEFTVPEGKLISGIYSEALVCDYEILSVTGTVEK